MSCNIFKNKVNITTENKVYFWSIFTTGLVGLFSLWLGIAIQDDINSKNARETQKLARYQMVEAVYPKFEQYIDTSGLVFYDFLEIEETPVENKAELVGRYYLQNQTSFVEAMLNSVNFLCNSRYYFGAEAQEQVCRNNVSILFGLRLLDQEHAFLNEVIKQWSNSPNINDSIKIELRNSFYTKNLFSYRQQAEDYICAKSNALIGKFKTAEKNTSSLVDAVVYDLIFTPYIDNFNIFSQEMSPAPDVSQHLGKHIILFAFCIISGLFFCIFLLRFVFDVRIFTKEKNPQNPQTQDNN